MAAAFVQAWAASNTTTSSSEGTITISPSPSAGSLLVAVISVRTSATGLAFTTPAGWTKLSDGTAQNCNGAVFYKENASGSENSQTFAWTVKTGEYSMTLGEYSGVAVSSSMEAAAAFPAARWAWASCRRDWAASYGI